MQLLWITLAVLATTCAAGPACDERFKKLKALGKECAKDFPDFDMEKMKSFWKGDVTSADDVEPNTQCFFKCMIEKGNMIDSEGKIQKPPGMEGDLPEEIEADMKKCLPEKVTNCQEATKVMICAHTIIFNAMKAKKQE